jgi:hypothetical protein
MSPNLSTWKDGAALCQDREAGGETGMGKGVNRSLIWGNSSTGSCEMFIRYSCVRARGTHLTSLASVKGELFTRSTLSSL